MANVYIKYRDDNGTIVEKSNSSFVPLENGFSEAQVDDDVFSFVDAGIQQIYLWRYNEGTSEVEENVNQSIEQEESENDDSYITVFQKKSFLLPFNYNRTNTSDNRIFTTGFGDDYSMSSSKRFDSNNLNPYFVPFDAQISKIHLLVAGLGVSSNSFASIVNFNLELYDAAISGTGQKITDLILGIPTVGLNIGNWYDTPDLNTSGLRYTANFANNPIDIGDMKALGLLFRRKTGQNDFVAFRNANIYLEVIEK